MALRKPKDIEDLKQCIRTDANGDYLVFCVECDKWRFIAIQCAATIIYRTARGKTRSAVKDRYNFSVRCSTCLAKVDYLFSPAQIKQLIDRVL